MAGYSRYHVEIKSPFWRDFRGVVWAVNEREMEQREVDAEMLGWTCVYGLGAVGRLLAWWIQSKDVGKWERGI